MTEEGVLLVYQTYYFPLLRLNRALNSCHRKGTEQQALEELPSAK